VKRRRPKSSNVMRKRTFDAGGYGAGGVSRDLSGHVPRTCRVALRIVRDADRAGDVALMPGEETGHET